MNSSALAINYINNNILVLWVQCVLPDSFCCNKDDEDFSAAWCETEREMHGMCENAAEKYDSTQATHVLNYSNNAYLQAN